MNTYQRINYRKIYEDHYGPIPKEPNGRSYEIHHKDGDHTNNNPTNLEAVTLQEHYDLHYAQGDYGACYMMASQRMNRSPEEISQIASIQQRSRVANGTHHLLGGEIQRRLVAQGKHHLLSGDIQRRAALKRAAEGTLPAQGPKNPFWGGEIQRQTQLARLANGSHHSQQHWKCPHCDTEGHGSAIYFNWHGDNCGLVNEKNAFYFGGVRYANKKHAARALEITIYELNKRIHS
jgi:HNH endonuclease